MEQVLYKAKVACRIGGAFRRAGEVFPLPKFETVPHFLEEVQAGETKDSAGPAADVPASAARPRAGTSSAGKGPGQRPGVPGPMPGDLPGVVRD